MRRRVRKRAWVPLAVLSVLLLAVFLVARTQWLANEITRTARGAVSKQFGLLLDFDRVGVAWSRLAVRVEGIHVRHPREGELAYVDALEVRPDIASLFTRKIQIESITVDGGDLTLRFRHGQLANGPTLPPPSGGPSKPELPFRDLALSDLHVHVEHDALGTLDLPSVDVDVRNVQPRLLVGVLAQGGGITGAQCFNGPIGRVEGRVELTDWRTLRVALARVTTADVSLRVREAVVPLDLAGPVSADVDVAGPLPVFLCPVPHAPPLHGNVSLALRATADLAARRVSATGRAHGERLSFDVVFPDHTYVYGLGDRIDLSFTADQDQVRVDSLDGEYAGAHVTSPGRRPDHPLVVRLNLPPPGAPAGTLPRPTMEGHLDVAGLQLDRLLDEVAVTSFAKVVWGIDASVDAHADFLRFGDPPDPQRPALWADLHADTRNFAILREYHQFLPQVPVIGIPRGEVTGQITVDSENVRFRRLTGLFGPGNRSRVDVGMVQIRTKHDPRIPDFLLEGGRGDGIHLEDIGQIAGMPIAGLANATAGGGGPFSDPVITGEAHLRDFHYNGLPLGDLDTRRPWRYQNVRVDMPALEGRSGRSTYAARDGYLDFRRWTVTAGAHVSTDNFYLADYFHMFKFEGDPVFAPFTGQTMPRCRGPALAAGAAPDATPCVDPRDPLNSDPRRPVFASATGSGHLETDVSFVLGRPGDDPGGVLDVDLTARDLSATAFDEPLTHVDTHMHYAWLIRDRGFRGSRLNLDYLRGRYAGGEIDAAGSVDLGGVLHIAGRANNVALGRTRMLDGRGLGGTLDGTMVIEGTPDAQRWTLDADVRSLTAAARNFGDVALHLRAAPEGPSARDPNARPPRTRWTLDARALAGAVALDAGLSVPWRTTSWRDVDGAAHPDWERDWSHSDVSGSLALTRALDLVPFLPTRYAARLGAGAHATVRARVDLLHAHLGDLRGADARLTVDQLDLAAQSLRFALAPDAVLAACVHDRAYWVDPAAASSTAACARVPAQLVGGHPTVAHAAALPSARFVGPEGTRFGIAGGGTVDGRLGLSFRGEADLARFASLVPGVTWARGNALLQLNVTGDSAAPRLTGTLQLDDGAVAASALPTAVDGIDLLARFDGTQMTLDRARAHLGAGTIDLTGGVVHLAGRDIDRVDVPLVVRGLSLTPQSGVEIGLDADTRLVWSPGEENPLFAGDITLTRARYTRPINLSQDLSGNVDVGGGGGSLPLGGDSSDSGYDPSNDHVRLDLRVRTREPFRVANNLADAEINISSERPFRVMGTDQRLGVLGTLVIPRGHVQFRGNDFEVRRGRIEFDNPERIQPNFDVSAETEIRRNGDSNRNQWRIGLHAYGTPDHFSLDTSSEPALSREDIALMLTYRMTRAELDQAGGGNIAQALAVDALAAATGLDRTVRNVLPIVDDFRVGSAYSPTQGRTVPQVGVGWRINDRVRVGVSTDATDQHETRATGDIRINDNASVQGSWDNTNASSASPFGNAGVDFRYRLEFR